jgi:glycolate oxidase subunit GlcD
MSLTENTVVRGALIALLGRDRVLSATTSRQYETDATVSRGLRGIPDAVVLPRDVTEIQAVVEWSYEHGVVLVPRGGGTGLAGGAVPVQGGVVVGLERINEIVRFSPEQWRITVGAGITTQTVQRLARENGLLFPPDPGAAEQSQIGGNAATNAGGPHAFKYGSTGAWVTGIEAVISPGSVIQVGGDQRKDVGGYDIKNLLVGSEGTLGIITAVTLRLLPAPQQTRPLVLFFGGPAEGVNCIRDLLASGLQPAALDYIDDVTLGIVRSTYPGNAPDDAEFALLVELDGSVQEVIQAQQDLEELAAPYRLTMDEPAAGDLWRWRDGVSGAVAAARGGKVSEDIVVPLESLDTAIEGIRTIGHDLGLTSCSWGHAGDGNMHACFLVNPHDTEELTLANRASSHLFELAIDLGGSITGEHGIGYLKRGQLARQWDVAALELHEQIKQTFDPRGIFNPGKKVAQFTPTNPGPGA